MRDATWWPMETQRGHDLLLRAFLRVTVQEGAAVLARADRETALEILVARAESDPPLAGAPHALGSCDGLLGGHAQASGSRPASVPKHRQPSPAPSSSPCELLVSSTRFR